MRVMRYYRRPTNPPRPKKYIIPARDPKQCGGAKGDATSGGDDEEDDTQMSREGQTYAST